MGILEGFIYTLWRGLAIGVIISAPMGPVGILCIQRTLDKGRKAGLYTGVGAALSDILYCLLTGFGLSFIEDFLERNSNVIQLLGSIVLIGFGIYLFRANPSRTLKKPTDNRIPAGRNILNGFLFTFSNPLIIFLIIGLFARFNFLSPEMKSYHYVFGYMAIFAGALLWWYIITYFVDKVRAHFNLRSMWLINKIIGGVIFIFALVGIVTAVSGIAMAERRATYMNHARGYSLFKNATDSALVITASTDVPAKDLIPVNASGKEEWRLRITSRNNARGNTTSWLSPDGKRHKARYPAWGFIFKGAEGEMQVSFKTRDDNVNETYSSPSVEMTAEAGGKEISRKTLYSGFDLYDGENAFRIIVSGNELILEGGNRKYESLVSCTYPGNRIDSIGFIAYPGAEIMVNALSIHPQGVFNVADVTANIDQLLAQARSSSDELEGEWGVFDMKLDDDKLRIGGNYRLAIIRDSDIYKIIYLSGAVTNDKSWKPGMIKGYVYPAPFENIYEIEWIGTSGGSLKGIKTQLEGDILSLQFPQHDSDLRLRKIQ